MIIRVFKMAVFTAVLFNATISPAQLPALHEGDLLFQNLDCGPLCDAIEEVTSGYNDSSFSHIGMVVFRHDSTWVIEAIGKGVHLTSVPNFMARSHHMVYVGRVKKQYQYMVPAAVSYALSCIDIPYDDVFLYNNGKYYCSELVYDAYKKANKNKPFFRLEPMTFCPPKSKVFYPAWVEYYKKIVAPIPQGKPGINPGGISGSDKIDIINK